MEALHGFEFFQWDAASASKKRIPPVGWVIFARRNQKDRSTQEVRSAVT